MTHTPERREIHPHIIIFEAHIAVRKSNIAADPVGGLIPKALKELQTVWVTQMQSGC